MPLVSKAFGDIITFTRASTATYFDSAGVLQSAAINAPRFDYNPSTLAAQGLLIEEARTNSLTYSEDFGNVAWVLSGASVSTNTTTSPAGTTTADSLVEDASASGHRIAQVVSANSTLTYTVTFFVKASGRTWATVLIDDNGGNGCRGFYNLSTGVVGTLSTSGTASGGVQSITSIGNGWYRCSLTCVPSSVNSTSVRAYVSGTTGDTVGSYAGTNGLTSVFLWGAQLEAGAFPTSYIPTTTTALTRSADAASTPVGPWFNSTASTLYAEWTNIAAAIPTGVTQLVTEIAELTNLNFYRIFQSQAAGAKASTNMFSGGANPGRLDSGGAYSNATVKAAAAFAASDRAISANGAVATTSATGALPVGVTTLFLGQQAGSTNFLNGYLRRIVYYPRRLSNAELQAITA